MLIHVSPTLFFPFVHTGIRVVSVSLAEFGLNLTGDVEITARRPHPNKNINVACRKVGRKAVNGLFIETDKATKEFHVETIWEVSGAVKDASPLRLTHLVKHSVIDEDFDAVTDDPIFWFATGDGKWDSRWPLEHYRGEGDKPVAPIYIAPRMVAKYPADQDKGKYKPTIDRIEDGLIVGREEQFFTPTVQRERLLGDRAHGYGFPLLEHAFRA